MFELIIPVMKKPSVNKAIEYYNSLDKCISKVTLVDFRPEYTNQIIKNRDFTHLEVSGREFFNKSYALNIGIFKSKSENLICCDADVLISVGTLIKWKYFIQKDPTSFIYLDKVYESNDGSSRPGYGIVCGARKQFISVGGYDSSFIGWGFEDLDLINRVKREVQVYSIGSGTHLSHSDAERTDNYRERCKMISRKTNLDKYESEKNNSEKSGTYQKDIFEYAV